MVFGYLKLIYMLRIYLPSAGLVWFFSAHRKSDGARVYKKGPSKGGRILFTSDRSKDNKITVFRVFKIAERLPEGYFNEIVFRVRGRYTQYN